MLLSPVAPMDVETSAPVTIRLIGTLDRVLVEQFSDAVVGLTAPGPRSLIIRVRDVTVVPGENLDRFLATLQQLETAGQHIVVDATPAFRKLCATRGVAFAPSSVGDGKASRRQLIIAHSSDKRTGAA